MGLTLRMDMSLRGGLGGASGQTPATLSAATITAFTDATADLSVTTDKSGGTLYYVIDTSATPPTKAQVKAGQGSGGGAAASSGSQAVASSGAQVKTGATGLSENSTYYAYFMQETAAGQSNVAASAPFTTYYTASQAIFTAFTTPPVTARKTLINTCVGSLKTAGIWTKLDTLYVMAAADSQAATINWVSPSSYALIGVNSPAFAADRGYTGDGSSSRLRTQFTPSTNGVNYTQNSASMWLWSLTNAAASVNDIGNVSVGVTNARIAVRAVGDNFSARLNSGTTASIANASSIGFFGTSRANSTTQKAWKNGTQLGVDQATTSSGVADGEQWLCGANATSFGAKQESVAAYGAALTGLENSFYSTLLTYLQAVGAA